MRKQIKQFTRYIKHMEMSVKKKRINKKQHKNLFLVEEKEMSSNLIA